MDILVGILRAWHDIAEGLLGTLKTAGVWLFYAIVGIFALGGVVSLIDYHEKEEKKKKRKNRRKKKKSLKKKK